VQSITLTETDYPLTGLRVGEFGVLTAVVDGGAMSKVGDIVFGGREDVFNTRCRSSIYRSGCAIQCRRYRPLAPGEALVVRRR
jgi:hypothetical protein